MPLPPGKNRPPWLLYHQGHNPWAWSFSYNRCVINFLACIWGCMAEFTIAGPKDSCADLDCIKTVGCVPIGYSRIAAHARTHTNVKNASGVSNFAQTPDGQRRNRMTIDTPSQSVRSSIQLAEPEPVRVSGLAPKHVGRKEIPCNYLQSCKEN